MSLIAFKMLSLFAAIASVTSFKLSNLICSSDFSKRLILEDILSAIIYPPDFPGKHNLDVPIFSVLEHCTADDVFY